MADIYLIVHGQQKGPFTAEEVWMDLTEGRIPNTTQAWHQGLQNWVRVDELIYQSEVPDVVAQTPAAEIKSKGSESLAGPRIILRPVREQSSVQFEEACPMPPMLVTDPPIPVPTPVLANYPAARSITEKEMAIFVTVLSAAVVLVVLFLAISNRPSASHAQTASSKSDVDAAMPQALGTSPVANADATSSPQAHITSPDTEAGSTSTTSTSNTCDQSGSNGNNLPAPEVTQAPQGTQSNPRSSDGASTPVSLPMDSSVVHNRVWFRILDPAQNSNTAWFGKLVNEQNGTSTDIIVDFGKELNLARDDRLEGKYLPTNETARWNDSPYRVYKLQGDFKFVDPLSVQ